MFLLPIYLKEITSLKFDNAKNDLSNAFSLQTAFINKILAREIRVALKPLIAISPVCTKVRY